MDSRYGRWSILGPGKRLNGQRYYHAVCDCGVRREVSALSLRNGRSSSCGCLHRDLMREMRPNLSHGEASPGRVTTEYYIWQAMNARCANPRNPAYGRYGGRGIAVCARWRRFEHFLDDMGRRPGPEYSLDRIDNDGGYSPDNCRWATRKQQARNKRTNRLLTYLGRTQPLAAWANELGLGITTLHNRLAYLGWPVERALSAPLYSRG